MTVTLTREMYRGGIYQGKLIGNIHISGTYKGGLCELSPPPNKSERDSVSNPLLSRTVK